MPWKVWLMVLVGANMIAPMIFISRLEAQITLATMLASMGLMTFLTARFGFSRILGLGHILWIPMLMFLFPRLSSIPADSPFGIWIRVLFVVNIVSILIDAVDVFRYVSGDREETVTDL